MEIPDVNHYIAAGFAGVEFLFRIEGPHAELFICEYGWNPSKDKYLEKDADRHIFKPFPLTEINLVEISCRYTNKVRREEEIVTISYEKFVILPNTPENVDFEMMNEAGYSPYNNYSPDPEIDKKYRFDRTRDRFNLGFVNVRQEGVQFWWDSSGLTNIGLGDCNANLINEFGSYENLEYILGGQGRYDICASFVRKNKP